MNTLGRIVAIDYGAKRVGIAVTDPMQIIATALTTVPTKELMGFLKTYFEEEEVEQLVVGYPLGLNDQPTHATPLVDKFVKDFNKKFPNLPVALEDESYTSKDAARMLYAAGYKQKDRRKKENLDKVSAALILQSYLEKRS